MALELLWCGLAIGRGGGALPGGLIGQQLLDSIEFWSGQGCELFNACFGSVPWHECPQGCSHSFREALYLVLVTFLGMLPYSSIRKRHCPFPLASCLWGDLILLCFSGTWSVCEESSEWVWFLVGFFRRSCAWADKAGTTCRSPRPVRGLGRGAVRG